MKLLQWTGALAVPLLVWPTLAFGQFSFNAGTPCDSTPCQAGFSFSLGGKSDKLPVGPWYLYWPLEAHFKSSVPGFPPMQPSPMVLPPQFAPPMPAAMVPFGMIPPRMPYYPPPAAAPYVAPMPYAPANPSPVAPPGLRPPGALPPSPSSDGAAGPRPVSYWIPQAPSYWYSR